MFEILNSNLNFNFNLLRLPSLVTSEIGCAPERGQSHGQSPMVAIVKMAIIKMAIIKMAPRRRRFG